MEETKVIEDEQKSLLTSVPAVMAERLKSVEEKEKDGGFSKQVFLKIGNIYLQEAFRRASRRTSEKERRKLPDIKKEAALVALMAMLSAQSLSVDTKTLTTVKKISEVVMEGTGITAMALWLQSQKKDREEILIASGRQRVVEALLDIRYNVETENMFTSFEKMRNTVNEIQEWLKIVAALNRNAETYPHFRRLATSVGNSLVWNKERVYLSLIVGITLGKEQASFSFSDLLRFCEIVRTDSWPETIREKLRAIIIEDLNSSLADIKTVKDLLVDIELSYNKTVFYYFKKVLFGNSDSESLLRDADKVLTQAALTIGRFTGQNISTEDCLTEIKKRVNVTLGNQSTVVAYQIIHEYPHLIRWLNKNELFRMAAFDHLNDKNLQAIADTYRVGEAYRDCANYINSTVTIAEVVRDITEGRKLFGLNLKFFSKNKSLMTGRRKFVSDVERRRIYKSLMVHASRVFTPKAFSSWATSIEEMNPGVDLDLTGVNVSHISASFLMTPEGQLPISVSKIMVAKPWIKYIDSYAIEYFKQKIGNIQNQKKR